MKNIVYIRMRHRIQVKENHRIRVKDVARIIASKEQTHRLEEIPVYTVTKQDQNTIVIDCMAVISAIRKYEKDLEIQPIGPAQTIVEVIYRIRKPSMILFFLAWLVLFIGSAITIMNFHEDVSMQKVQQKLYFLLTGIKEDKPLIFQIPYSFGLGLGMVLFFNHVFKKRFNEEPSPLEVEMNNYQQAVDQYIIMHENKESVKKIYD
ncbi:stage V sporulation protein AA [Fervidibacillus halotolerans]|uniref:Stage V sporulation protein AA n=1 Tax=Fervidibacillus halotolerans TaxID=2980027 RepID=A0A9E8S040_9BACI|nr:stage V sporulation protein AA [Fervidibacillus halotolerans]WAA13814.1 stage V sporulation protein AA [Fervidibacillus halotolerans]